MDERNTNASKLSHHFIFLRARPVDRRYTTLEKVFYFQRGNRTYHFLHFTPHTSHPTSDTRVKIINPASQEHCANLRHVLIPNVLTRNLLLTSQFFFELYAFIIP